jgi:hypothetical protein
LADERKGTAMLRSCVATVSVVLAVGVLGGCARPPEPTPERIADDLSAHVPFGCLDVYIRDCSDTGQRSLDHATESFSADGLKVASKSTGFRTVTFQVEAKCSDSDTVFHGWITYKQTGETYKPTELSGSLRVPE